MEKWEYTIVRHSYPDNILLMSDSHQRSIEMDTLRVLQLNEYGENGWEVITSNWGESFLKRKKPAQQINKLL